MASRTSGCTVALLSLAKLCVGFMSNQSSRPRVLWSGAFGHPDWWFSAANGTGTSRAAPDSFEVPYRFYCMQGRLSVLQRQLVDGAMNPYFPGSSFPEAVGPRQIRQNANEVTSMKTSALLLAVTLALMMLAGAQDNRQSGALSQKGQDRIVREVHHELVMLPFYKM